MTFSRFSDRIISLFARAWDFPGNTGIFRRFLVVCRNIARTKITKLVDCLKDNGIVFVTDGGG